MAIKKKVPAAKKVAPDRVAAPKKAAPKPAPKKKAVSKPITVKAAPKRAVAVTNKPSAIEQIAALQAQMTELKLEAVSELKEKLSLARGAVKDLEGELATLTNGSVRKRTRKSS